MLGLLLVLRLALIHYLRGLNPSMNKPHSNPSISTTEKNQDLMNSILQQLTRIADAQEVIAAFYYDQMQDGPVSDSDDDTGHFTHLGQRDPI